MRKERACDDQSWDTRTRGGSNRGKRLSHFPRQTVRIRTVCRGKCQNLQARFDATCDDPAKPSQLGAPALCSLPCRLFDLTNLVESARALLSAGALLCPYGLPTVGGPRSYRLGSQPLRRPLCGNVPVTLPRQTGYDGVFKCTYRVTSLIKTRTSLGPNRRPMPKVRLRSEEGVPVTLP